MRSLLMVAALGSLASAESPPSNQTLSPDQAAEVMRRNAAVFRRCFSAELRVHPDMTGKFVYEITIEASGKVRRAIAKQPTPKSKRVDACITKAIEKIRFPSAISSSTILYPFMSEGPSS